MRFMVFGLFQSWRQGLDVKACQWRKLSTLQLWNVLVHQCRKSKFISQHTKSAISWHRSNSLNIRLMFWKEVFCKQKHILLWSLFSVFQTKMFFLRRYHWRTSPVLQLTASHWTTEASTSERWQFGALTNRKATSSNRAPSLSSLYCY